MKKLNKKYFLVIVLLSQISATVLAQSSDIEKIVQNSWGLKNDGSIQVFDLSPLQTYRLQARVGQDIHLALPQKSVLGRKIRVAVVDTGVDVDHPLLKNQIAFKNGECVALQKYEQCVLENGMAGCTELLDTTKPGVDSDKNLYPADCHGWSILADPTTQNIIGTPSFTDSIGHGTHVAGVIASVSKNIEILPIQVIGDAPNQPVKPFSIDLSPDENKRGGTGNDPSLADRIARGIIYAIYAKADVINLSIGWPQGQDAEIMRSAIAEAQARGIIVVAAAGNDSTTSLLRPCQYKGVICVAAHRPDGSLAQFSNYGFGVDIAAPGVSIVSSIPSDNRSIRLPGFSGVDILSGTSQASPFVAGVIAEMLSRGIKPQDIYPRLILGSRPVQSELPLIVGPIQTAGVLKTSNEPYIKYVLSGLLDMQKSLDVQVQPLILNANKDIQIIKWNRKNSKMNFNFPIKNYWKDIFGHKIDVKVTLKNPSNITPVVSKVTLTNLNNSLQNKMSKNNFLNQEEKNINVELEIKDSADASKSQIPSDLGFDVQILIDGLPVLNGLALKSFEMRAEVIVEIDKSYRADDVQIIPISGQLERGMKKFIVDEIYDNNPNDRDYIALTREEKSFLVALMKYENGKYSIGPQLDIPFEGNIQSTKPYSRIRIDIDGDGVSEYVLGLQEFKEQSGQFTLGDYTMHFYIFDQNMKLKKHVQFYDDRALIALDFTWIKIGRELRPAWVALGKNVVKKYDITDLWQVNAGDKVKLGSDDIHLYYLDENYKLAVVENESGFKIVDILQPRAENVQSGILPVLLAKNLGSEVRPSYLNQFSMGWVTNGILSGTKTVLKVSADQDYRNLIDTKKDKTVNLSKTADEYLGTFWFGFDAHQKQRVTLIDYKTNSIVDQILPNDRSLFDAPLRIRAAYSNANQKGVFLITNTEIEYHDLINQTIARSSLNKYTFFGDDLIVDLQFPVSITAKNGLDKIPALFTTEGSGLNKGVKFLIPTQMSDTGNNRKFKMISPARLRLSSPQGCKAVDSPVYVNGGYHLDYDCGTEIMRFKLTY